MNASMPLRLLESVTSVMTNLEPIRFDARGGVPAMEVVADWKNGLPRSRAAG